jgi:hypothetical protein
MPKQLLVDQKPKLRNTVYGIGFLDSQNKNQKGFLKDEDARSMTKNIMKNNMRSNVKAAQLEKKPTDKRMVSTMTQFYMDARNKKHSKKESGQILQGVVLPVLANKTTS